MLTSGAYLFIIVSHVVLIKILSLFVVCFSLFTTSAQAQNHYGGEIVSYQTFGEGLMVTRARMVPLTGTATNIFFYNRADLPWNNNEWYEYDWEIRGRFPKAA